MSALLLTGCSEIATKHQMSLSVSVKIMNFSPFDRSFLTYSQVRRKARVLSPLRFYMS